MVCRRMPLKDTPDADLRGTPLERVVEAIVQGQGYETYRPPKGKYVKQDMFGADILCRRRGKPLRFIQVSTYNNLTYKSRQIEGANSGRYDPEDVFRYHIEEWLWGKYGRGSSRQWAFRIRFWSGKWSEPMFMDRNGRPMWEASSGSTT